MAFCTSCGKQLDDGSLFCEHCGARQSEPVSAGTVPPAAPPQPDPVQPAYASVPSYGEPQSAPEQADSPYGQPAAPAAPRKPIPKGVKIAIIAVAAVVVLAALFIFIMGKLNDPQKTISSFVESIAAQDYEQFSKVTCSASEDLELTEDTVAPFFELYSSNLSTLEDYQESLAADLKQLQRGKQSTGNGLIRLVEHNHVIFKSYEVELSGANFYFSAPLDNTQVTVGGKTVDLKEAEKTYQALLLPGRYDIEASCTDSLLGETFSSQLKDCDLTPSNNEWYVDLEYTTIYLEDIGLAVSSLTVNGKDYGPVEFDSWGEMALYPLPEDVEIEVTYDVGGVTLSDSYAWSGGYIWEYFSPDPSLSEMTARTMMDQVGVFMRGFIEDYNSGDLTDLTADLGDTPVIKFYASELEDSQDLDSYYREVYHYTLREMQGDLDWSRDYSNGKLSFSTLFFLGLDYICEFYMDGELQPDETAPTEPYQDDNMMRVTVQMINGKWTVTNLQWASYYDISDMSDPYMM